MNYFNQIDPIGEDMNDDVCLYCENESNGAYCSDYCEMADYKENINN